MTTAADTSHYHGGGVRDLYAVFAVHVALAADAYVALVVRVLAAQEYGMTAEYRRKPAAIHGYLTAACPDRFRPGVNVGVRLS